jgi:integrase
MGTALEYHHDPSDDSDLPPLPQRILSRDGTIVETFPSVWHLTAASGLGPKYQLDWELIEQAGITPRARHLLQLYLADRITKKAAGTVRANYSSLTYFVRWLTPLATDQTLILDAPHFNWSDLNEGLARAYLEWAKTHTAKKGTHFSCLRVFYAWGFARGYADFRWDTLRQLQSIQVGADATGHNVRFRHPVKGPFSPDELFLIREALQAQKGTNQDRAIVMLHLELGLNPHASIQLTNADLRCHETEQLTTYQVDVPRMKKRTIHREVKRRPISNTLGQLLEQLQQGAPGDQLLHWLSPGAPVWAVRNAMHRFVKAANIVSPHTHRLLNMTPRRFRTSLATHMAAQGASNFHIAEILDHSDLQHVKVYTQTVSSIADLVAAATDPIVQPLVHRFLGKIVDIAETHVEQETASQQIPALVPHLPIPLLNTGGIGHCGKKDGVCRLLPPLSCYLCPSFVASRQGPHQEILTALLTFLQPNEEMGDERLKRQLDDVCLAIREVLAQLGTPVSVQNGSSAMDGNEG